MKKTLLLAGVAALFAGSAQAATGLELGIEGYASVYGIYADQDEASVATTRSSEFGIRKEMEIDLTGEVALENGVKVGVSIASMQDTASEADDVKKSYIYAESGMGKLIVGKEYNAAYLMQVTAPVVDAELDGMDPTYNISYNGGTTVADASYDMSTQGTANSPVGDKITYISPIMSGLQLGASYTPEVSDDAATGGFGGRDAGKNAAQALAARYSTEVAGVDVTLGTGWNKEDNNLEQYNFAATVDLGAVDFGAGYYVQESESSAPSDATAVTAGASYESGAYRYAVSYLYKEREEDDLSRYMTGVNYTYGPGMTLNGSVAYNSYESDNNSTAQNDATVVALGTVINF